MLVGPPLIVTFSPSLSVQTTSRMSSMDLRAVASAESQPDAIPAPGFGRQSDAPEALPHTVEPAGGEGVPWPAGEPDPPGD